MRNKESRVVLHDVGQRQWELHGSSARMKCSCADTEVPCGNRVCHFPFCCSCCYFIMNFSVNFSYVVQEENLLVIYSACICIYHLFGH